jgi:hypothetical protein
VTNPINSFSDYQRLEAERTDISYRKSPYRYDLLDELMPKITSHQRMFLLSGMYIQGLNTADAQKAITELLEYLEERERKLWMSR